MVRKLNFMAKKKTTKSTIPSLFLSSTGDGSISLTLKGIAVLVIITGLEYFGITADKGQILEIVNNLATIVAAGYTIYGIARKIK